MKAPRLEKIKVAAPCKAEWKWMYGNDRVRFCGQCNQNVYNLSAMTREEAENLIMRTEGRLCVKFYRRKDGTILTKNCPVGLQAFKAKLTATKTHVIAAILSFLSYFGGHWWARYELPLKSAVNVNQFEYKAFDSHKVDPIKPGHIMGALPNRLRVRKPSSKPRSLPIYPLGKQ